MNKTYQRIILIVAIVICGLAYGLRSWQQSTPQPSNIDTTQRAMRLFVEDIEVSAVLQKPEQFWLMSLKRTENDPISTVQDSVMGGLGSKVLAVQIVLHDAQERTEWQQNYHAEYPNIMQLYPPKAEIPTLLKHLRACMDDCLNRSRFLYLLEPKDFTVRYYGEQHWSVLELVQDIQRLLGAA